MIHLDFETRSKADIWQCGAWVYAEHPSTEILCMAYAIDEGPVKIVTKEDFLMHKNLGWPCEDLFAAIASGMPIVAHNAFFEQAIWNNIMVRFYDQPRVPIKQWRCTMAKALARSLPRSLLECGKALNCGVLKDEAGKRIMLKVSKPKPDGTWNEKEEDLEKLYEYCINDVEAERAIDKILPDLIPSEQTIWFLDQLINQRGIYVDSSAINRSLEYIEEFTKDAQDFVSNVSNGKLDGVSRRMAVLQWCQDQGVDITGYTKKDIKAVLERTDLPQNVRSVLETRVQLGKTSTAKYEAMRNSLSSDGRIRDLLIYHGASTGRWAGKLLQLQNLPKGELKDIDTAIQLLKTSSLKDFGLFYPDVMGTLSSCIRGMIISSPDHDFIIADYNAIEARVVMWLAGEERGLKQFKEGIDLYVEMARVIYSRSDIGKDSIERQLGKAAVLGCGYQMGPAKFLATCTAWGIPISEDLAKKAVETYRSVYSRVADSWIEQEAAAIRCVETGKDASCGKIRWFMDNTALLCQLPSRRSIVYNSPTLEYIETPWKTRKLALHYMDLNSVTKRWERNYTYGGKLVENITQAVARDLLASAMLRAEVKGYKVAFSVHDEIVSEVQENFGSIEEFEKILCDSPTWAQGCPIVAKGFRTKRYRK